MKCSSCRSPRSERDYKVGDTCPKCGAGKLYKASIEWANLRSYLASDDEIQAAFTRALGHRKEKIVNFRFNATLTHLDANLRAHHDICELVSTIRQRVEMVIDGKGAPFTSNELLVVLDGAAKP